MPEYVMSFASLGAYRLEAMKIVQDHFGSSLNIYAGAAQDPAIRVISPDDLRYEVVGTRLLFNRILVQRLPLKKLLSCRVLLLDLNPRMPHVWILVFLRRTLKRPTVLWGHAFPRAGKRAGTEVLRRTLRSIASGLVTYTRSQAVELSQIHPKKTINAAPNALYPARDFVFDDCAQRDSFVFVGRLIASKKPRILLEAFERVHSIRPDLRLVIVGDGPEMGSLIELVQKSKHQTQIELLGHIGDYQTLRSIYSRAIASVSPGYVGLSVTQSLSFGVPMIVSRDEPHSPEIEAVEVGCNAEFFDTDDAEDLARKVLQFASNKTTWMELGAKIAADCRDRYSAEVMADGLIQAMEAAK